MRSTLMGVSLICPYCHKPVDPTKPDAMMSGSAKQLQHRDCWTERSDPPSGNEPKSPSHTA
jgi:hypothetical protein